MTKAFVSLLALAVPMLLAAGPAYATKGIDAARACEANPKCTALYDEAGGVTILVGDTIIDCPGPQKECSVVRKARSTGIFNRELLNSQRAVALGN